MPGATTKLALPYPVPADTVDVPRDVKALADKLDPIIPPGVSLLAPGIATNANTGIWTLLPVSAPTEVSSSAGTPDFVRNGDGSLTCKTAGFYLFVCNWALGANIPYAAAYSGLIDFHVTAKAGNVLPTEADNAFASARMEFPSWSFTNFSVSGMRRFVVDDRVAAMVFNGITPSGTPRQMQVGVMAATRVAL